MPLRSMRAGQRFTLVVHRAQRARSPGPTGSSSRGSRVHIAISKERKENRYACTPSLVGTPRRVGP